MTVRDIKKHIEYYNLSDDAEVLIQRIEDRYFDGFDISGMTGILPGGTFGILPPGSKSTGWSVVKKEAQHYWEAVERNKKVDGEYHNKVMYPNIKDPEVYRTSDEGLEELKEQYIITFCCVKYPEDNNLYIDAHY